MTRGARITGLIRGLIILGLLALMGCEDEATEPKDELVGTWKSTEQTIRTYITTNSDQTFVDEDSNGVGSISIPANIPTVIDTLDVNTNETLVFAADGSYSLSYIYIELETCIGTWETEGSILTIILSGSCFGGVDSLFTFRATFDISGNVLTISVEEEIPCKIPDSCIQFYEVDLGLQSGSLESVVDTITTKYSRQ